MYAEIIPKIRTIPKFGCFDYKIPDSMHLNIGDVVYINFRNSKKIGVVYKIKKTCPYKKVKEIIAVEDRLRLNKEQMILIDWLAVKYNISLSLAVKILLPEIPVKKSTFTPNRFNPKIETISKNRISDVKMAIQKIKCSKLPILLHYNNESEKNAVLRGLIDNKNQVLIVVPQTQQAYNLASVFYKFSPIVYRSGLSKSENWQVWQKIKTGETKLIIGTKNAIFLPYSNLKLIVIDDEEDMSHKNFDQNPKYHVLEIAEQLKNKILLTSQAPLISSYDKFRNIKLFRNRPSQSLVVDMQNEKIGGNYSFFSNTLIESLNVSKKSLLIFNRKGYAKLLVCQNCREIISSTTILHCPRCQSLNLKKIVFGTTKLKQDLIKLFPYKKIIELTKETEFNIQEINDCDICLGTEFVLKFLHQIKFDLISILSVDHQLAAADELASERVFQLIRKLVNTNIKLIIQTNSPDNQIIQWAVANNYENFFKQEIRVKQFFKETNN
ncbi:MAG: DEAD/DEAH box helicase [Patescibacteria group bacterium]